MNRFLCTVDNLRKRVDKPALVGLQHTMIEGHAQKQSRDDHVSVGGASSVRDSLPSSDVACGVRCCCSPDSKAAMAIPQRLTLVFGFQWGRGGWCCGKWVRIINEHLYKMGIMVYWTKRDLHSPTAMLVHGVINCVSAKEIGS